MAVVSITIPRMQWIVGTPVLELGAWLLLQLPQAMVQTFPIALVLAVLLAFGRLATENELLALQRASDSRHQRWKLAEKLSGGVQVSAESGFR